MGVRQLGDSVVATHPSGHRIVGRIIGSGTDGVILDSPPLRAGFLSFADGWTCKPVGGRSATARQASPPLLQPFAPPSTQGAGFCGHHSVYEVCADCVPADASASSSEGPVA